MSEHPTRPAGPDPQRWAPGSPAIAVAPGALLVFVGLLVVFDGGPLALGWAAFTCGLALLLTGSVAAGVAWGMQLHDARR